MSGKDSENEVGWGFKYNNPIDEKETDIDPVLYPTEDPCVKKDHPIWYLQENLIYQAFWYLLFYRFHYKYQFTPNPHLFTTSPGKGH